MAEIVDLYRSALRIIGKLPYENIRNKMKFNTREIFEIYNHMSRTNKDFDTKAIIENGKRSLKTLERLLNQDPSLAENLFKSFGPISKEAQDASGFEKSLHERATKLEE